MDAYTKGDTLPIFTVVLLDGSSRFNPTGATEVRVKLWRDGALIVDKVADSADADGTVTLVISTLSTATITSLAGPVYGKVVCHYPGGIQSFPADGFFKTTIHPSTP